MLLTSGDIFKPMTPVENNKNIAAPFAAMLKSTLFIDGMLNRIIPAMAITATNFK